MALFESKADKQAKRKMAIRKSKKDVKRYADECDNMSTKYWDMAKKAKSLGDNSGCRQYIARRLQYEQQSNKWEAFLLKMEDLTMRGEMSNAMTGLVLGMQALNKEIRAGASAQDMTKTISDLNITMGQLEHTEDQLTDMMDNLDYEVGTPMGEGSDNVPDDLKAEVDRLESELMDEVVIDEKTGDAVGGDSVDNRIKSGMERLRKLKAK